MTGFQHAIYICCHCHSYLKGTGRYCPDCTTAEKRRAMDEANKKHFEEHGLVFQCNECKKI